MDRNTSNPFGVFFRAILLWGASLACLAAQSCSSSLPSTQQEFRGSNYISFQVDDARIYLWNSLQSPPECSDSTWLLLLLQKGYLTGRDLSLSLSDQGQISSRRIDSLKHHEPTYPDDMRYFSADCQAHTYEIYSMTKPSVSAGPVHDTLDFRITVDIAIPGAGSGPGPLAVYHIKLAVLPASRGTACPHAADILRLISCKNVGWII